MMEPAPDLNPEQRKALAMQAVLEATSESGMTDRQQAALASVERAFAIASKLTSQQEMKPKTHFETRIEINDFPQQTRYRVRAWRWCGLMCCGVVWCGVVWCGVVRRGVVWCGAVWCYVSCFVLCGVVFVSCNFLSASL